MKTTAVGTYGLQLTRYNFVNCYLVRETDGLTLVDAGLPGSAPAILAAAATAGAPIRHILLTHAHGDHVGSLDALVDRLDGVEVAASARSVPLLRKPPDKTFPPGEASGTVVLTPGVRTAVTRILSEGDRCGSLLVIDTPGHIPGHVSFLDERDGTLYAGDIVIGMSGLMIAGTGPWWFPPMSSFTWSRSAALASARKLLDYPIERFATGHRAVRGGGLTPLRAALAKVAA